MGKKKQRAHQVSKGERNSVARSTTKAIRRDYMKSSARMDNQLKAYRAGKNVVVTIANPNKNEKNKPFIKVDGRDYFRQVRT